MWNNEGNGREGEEGILFSSRRGGERFFFVLKKRSGSCLFHALSLL